MTEATEFAENTPGHAGTRESTFITATHSEKNETLFAH
jgi:hypothetical protein